VIDDSDFPFYRCVEDDPYAKLKEAQRKSLTIQVRSVEGFWVDVPQTKFRAALEDYRVKPCVRLYLYEGAFYIAKDGKEKQGRALTDWLYL
jgi:hypothetical protein